MGMYNKIKKAATKTTTARSSTTSKSHSRSARAGLKFPVGRIGRYLRKAAFSKRLGAMGPVYLAGVLQYLTSEFIELAGDVAMDKKKTRIVPRHIMLASHNDAEIAELLSNVTVASSGVRPHVESRLLPSAKGSIN